VLIRRSGSTPWNNGLFTAPRRPAQLRELRGGHAASPLYRLRSHGAHSRVGSAQGRSGVSVIRGAKPRQPPVTEPCSQRRSPYRSALTATHWPTRCWVTPPSRSRQAFAAKRASIAVVSVVTATQSTTSPLRAGQRARIPPYMDLPGSRLSAGEGHWLRVAEPESV
jgi:hypothetical protein